MQTRGITFSSWETRLLIKYVIFGLHFVLKVFIILLLLKFVMLLLVFTMLLFKFIVLLLVIGAHHVVEVHVVNFHLVC